MVRRIKTRSRKKRRDVLRGFPTAKDMAAAEAMARRVDPALVAMMNAEGK